MEYSKNGRHKQAINISEMVYGKIPPQSKELEDAVLGALLLESSSYDKISDILRSECFYVTSNQIIYQAIQKLNVKCQPVDCLTVVEELKKECRLEEVGGAYYVTKLTNNVVSSANIETHARIILENFIKREIIRIASELITSAFENHSDAFSLLGEAEEKIFNIGISNISAGMLDISSVLVQAVSKIEEWRKMGTAITGIPSGYKNLDFATRGWQPGDLIILAARPSVGKTALALNIIRNAALNKDRPTAVGVWSLEMKAFQLAIRMISAESKIFMHNIQTGRLTDEQMKHLYDSAIQVLINSKIYFDDSSGINMINLKSNARRMKKKNNIGLIVVDYLQLMKGSEKGKTRDEDIGGVAIELKGLAQELQIPIIAISSLSRETEKRVGGTPKISDLRESGAIEYAADLIMLLYGNSEDDIIRDPSLKYRRYLKIAKQRNGVLITEEFDFKNEYQLYESIKRIPGHNLGGKDYSGDNPF